MFFAGSGWGIGFPLAQRGPQPSRWGQAVSWWLCRLETARALWVLCRLTDGGVALAGKITFLPARRGPKPLFLFREKKTAVLDSEKEKVDQWEYWGGALQPDVGFVLLWYPSGEGLWGIPFVSGGLGFGYGGEEHDGYGVCEDAGELDEGHGHAGEGSVDA